MAREILFRGKRIDTDEWVYGSFCMDALELKNGLCGVDGFIRLYDFDKGKLKMYEVDRETVSQFTGLTDKNGKRIFEGDIIKILPTVTFDPNCEWETCFVHFYRGSFVCSPIRFLGKDKIPGWQLRNLIENYKLVIGKIHDNPELLHGTES